MFEDEIRLLNFMQGYGDALLKDIAPQDICRQPIEGMNHPAWILGHLAWVADRHAGYAGDTPKLESWAARFSGGTKPTTNPSDYPAKDELIAAWHDANARLIAAASKATDETLNKPTPSDRLRLTFPTLREFLPFSMTSHTSLHIGQLSAWRRAMGQPPLF